ncbi:MAG: cytochrome c556 [Phenylobacterium sp.]|jgi:cytochrome c556
MKLLSKGAIVLVSVMASSFAFASQPAKNLKHAQKSAQLRQSVFSLIGSNMKPIGGMLKGKIAFDAVRVEKSALRINQLSLMIADYMKTDTSAHKVETEALDVVWQKQAKFAEKIEALTMASAKLQKVAATKDEKATKGAMKNVGRACGSCHDDFKAE